MGAAGVLANSVLTGKLLLLLLLPLECKHGGWHPLGIVPGYSCTVYGMHVLQLAYPDQGIGKYVIPCSLAGDMQDKSSLVAG